MAVHGDDGLYSSEQQLHSTCHQVYNAMEWCCYTLTQVHGKMVCIGVCVFEGMMLLKLSNK